MGKKKNKKSDLQKVKFKVGRTLPRKQNDTDTKFKTQKIKIVGQFKEPASETRTHSSRTIEDVLKKASHSNTNVRHQALLDLLQLLHSHKKLAEEHLFSLIDVIASAFHDNTSSVRKEALNVWSFILECVMQEKIAAFKHILIPHVSCAMTSIHHDIRMDSLKVLDVCLDEIPFIIMSSEKIFKNFLSQISFENNPLSHKSGFQESSFSSRIPSERIKSYNWRANVLCTLAKFLKVTTMHICQEVDKVPQAYNSLQMPSVNIKIAEFLDLEEYITTLMPVLLNVWAEAAPMPYGKGGSGEIVSADATKTMDSVLQVVQLICEWITVVDKSNENTKLMIWFNHKFRKVLFGRLMVYFPYSQHVSIGKKKKIADAEASCQAVNLAICKIYSLLPQDRLHSSSLLYQRVTDYLLNLITSSSSAGGNSFVTIVEILRKLIAASNIKSFEMHLNTLFKHYQVLDGERQEKKVFLEFVMDQVYDFQNKEFLEKMQMMKLLAKKLMEELIKMFRTSKVEEHTLDVIKRLNVIGFGPFVEELQTNHLVLLEMIQSGVEEIQRTAVFFFSRLTQIKKDFFVCLAKVIHNPAVQVKTVESLLCTLNHELEHPFKEVPAFSAKDYINFLFSVAIGMFKDEIDMYMNLAQNIQKKYRDIIPFYVSEYAVVPSTNLPRSLEITQAAIRALRAHDEHIAQCIHTYVEQFTTHCACLPAHSAAALLLLEAETCRYGHDTDDIDCLTCISEVTIALLMYQFVWEREKEVADVGPGSVMGPIYHTVPVLKNMRHVCEIIAQRVKEIASIEQAQCVICLMLLVIRKQLIPAEDVDEVICVLRKIHEIWGDDIKYDSWWINVNNEINLPPYCTE